MALRLPDWSVRRDDHRPASDHRLDQGRRPGRPGVVWLMAAKGQRLVRSVSAEGQSVSYESTPSTDKVPTAGVPPMSTVDHWRNAACTSGRPLPDTRIAAGAGGDSAKPSKDTRAARMILAARVQPRLRKAGDAASVSSTTPCT